MDAVGIPCTPAEIASPPRGVGTRTFPLSETETDVVDVCLDYNREILDAYVYIWKGGFERFGENRRICKIRLGRFWILDDHVRL